MVFKDFCFLHKKIKEQIIHVMKELDSEKGIDSLKKLGVSPEKNLFDYLIQPIHPS